MLEHKYFFFFCVDILLLQGDFSLLYIHYFGSHLLQDLTYLLDLRLPNFFKIHSIHTYTAFDYAYKVTTLFDSIHPSSTNASRRSSALKVVLLCFQ